MNFKTVFLVSLLIVLNLRGSMMQVRPECKVKTTDQDKVEVLVYINGDARIDIIWYRRFCSWRDNGFPYKKYAPVTVKVGGEVTCDQNNKCNCSNIDNDNVDCNMTFQNVCAEQILGQEKFQDLLCCSAKVKSQQNTDPKGFSQCVKEIAGLSEKIANCMKDQGPGGPQAIALKNANEVIKKGVNMAENTEPFFFYNGKFDKCISDESPIWFLDKICSMLKYDTAKSISQCVTAMGW